MANERGENRDIVLSPGTYAYLQDETRGQIKTHAGPCAVNQTAQDTPVRFDPRNNTFSKCTLEQAVQQCPIASEGDYIVLENPARDDSHPQSGVSAQLPDMQIGRKQNIPGPCTFALWPQQRATVLKGHRLRSNQYLIVRVYNEDEARRNWDSGVARPATPTGGEDGPEETVAPVQDLTIGKLMVIKGTEVSFYIPPTGVEVLPDENGEYVRNAISLERLEYCILVDEDGNKRYEKGPQVVFPAPTEIFFTETINGQSIRKFKAIELNTIQGVHIKVIEAYTEGGIEYKPGDEIFVTGEDCPIYFPRAEHSIIMYGDKRKHYATAIPAGEGRYVMNRSTGEIKKQEGPQMLLPDPRNFVIIRRVLNDKECTLWYPNNNEVLQYNRSLRAVAGNNDARGGFVSEGAVQNYSNVQRSRGAQKLLSSTSYGASVGGFESLDMAEMEAVGDAATPDSFKRGTQYTQPRTITLDTKYEGCPVIGVWTGYAIMKVSKTGSRKVVQGPSTVLLDYDETLEVLTLSTGKPKTTDSLENTVYLRVSNNKVSDIIKVKTKDHVDVRLKLSYRVNFEGEPEAWFNVENYVKFLCDHCRSILKGVSQKTKIEEFYADGVKIIRDAILGEAPGEGGIRPGMLFEENGMRIVDVEILDIDVEDESISKMLSGAQHEIVRSNIELHQLEKDLEVAKRKEVIAQEKAEAESKTKELNHRLNQELIKLQTSTELARVEQAIAIAHENAKKQEAQEAVEDINAKAELERDKAISDFSLAKKRAESEITINSEKQLTAAIVERFGAMQPGLSEALLQLQSQETLTKVAQALSVQQLAGGKNLVDVIQQMFSGSPAQPLLDKVMERLQIKTTEVTNNN